MIAFRSTWIDPWDPEQYPDRCLELYTCLTSLYTQAYQISAQFGFSNPYNGTLEGFAQTISYLCSCLLVYKSALGFGSVTVFLDQI